MRHPVTPRILFTLCCLSLTLLVASSAAADHGDGMTHVDSAYDFEHTCDRLDSAIKAKGMTLFERVHHSEAAAEIGIDLAPSELFILGNPKVGSPLMRCAPTVALDLPQKILVWVDDADGESTVRVTYNDPAYLAKRHDIKACDDVLDKITKALAGLAAAATAD